MKWRLFVLFAVFAAVLPACSAPALSDSSTETIVVGEGYEWEALNPLLDFGTEGASKLFDGLIRHDATLKVVPALAAEEPAASADERSWTVKLRQGINFHDGSAFDADDVVATYRAALDPVFASTVRSDYPMLTGAWIVFHRRSSRRLPGHSCVPSTLQCSDALCRGQRSTARQD